MLDLVLRCTGSRSATLRLTTLASDRERLSAFVAQLQPTTVVLHMFEPFAVTGAALTALLSERPELAARLLIVTTGPAELHEAAGDLGAVPVMALPFDRAQFV